MTEGFCVRCRKKVEMRDEKRVTYKNKRSAIKGTCPECGGKVNKIIPTKKGFLDMLLPMPSPSKEKKSKEQGT